MKKKFSRNSLLQGKIITLEILWDYLNMRDRWNKGGSESMQTLFCARGSYRFWLPLERRKIFIYTSKI